MYMAYLPAEVRYHPNLSAEDKLLYAEITAYIDIKGRVRVDYARLREVFTRNTSEIKAMLKRLHDAGFIHRDGNSISIKEPSGESKLMEVDSTFIYAVVELWNTMFKDAIPFGIRKTAKLTKCLTDRQKSFSNEEIMTALKNRHGFVSTSEWHNRPENSNVRNSIFVVIESDDKLEQALNLIQDKPVQADLRKTTKAVVEHKSDKSLLE